MLSVASAEHTHEHVHRHPQLTQDHVTKDAARSAATASKDAEDVAAATSKSVASTSSQHGGNIGLKGYPWHAMGMELEMQPLDNADWKNNFSHAALLIRRALTKTVPCVGATPERQKQLQYLETQKYERIMRKAIPHWTMHEETDPGPLYELVAPWLGADAEAQTSVSITDLLSKDFGGGRFAALHLHVDGRCLVSGVKLATLLLLWERYHNAIMPLVAHRPSAKTYGPALATKHPDLLVALQKHWLKRTAQPSSNSSVEVEDLFVSLHDGMFKHANLGVLASMAERDGYRNFAINVCHLLNIRCCRACDKNQAPKHGLVEFRIFDVTYGERLRLLMQLVQRMVQHSCADEQDPSLKSHLFLPGVEPEQNLEPLLKFLAIDSAAFLNVFHEKPPEPPRKSLWKPRKPVRTLDEPRRLS